MLVAHRTSQSSANKKHTPPSPAAIPGEASKKVTKLGPSFITKGGPFSLISLPQPHPKLIKLNPTAETAVALSTTKAVELTIFKI